MKDRAYTRQLRIFLEEICAELCRFQHVSGEGLAPEDVLIKREASLGVPGVFFDITVRLPDRQPYFVEVKFGYPREFLITHLSKKFGPDIAETAEAERLVVLVRTADYSNWAEIESELRSALRPNLQLDIWDETHLLQLIHECFGVKIDTITGDDLISVRRAIDDSKWRYAFGDTHADHYLADTLLWHFGFWTLHRLYKEQGIQPHEVLRPGLYRGVTILMADLCSFSSYVRDTRDEELIRHCLTAFYSRARYAIHNAGGMLYQFVGDEVVALFGLPDDSPSYTGKALDCARALVDVGNSVSNIWQRELDREQKSGGVHIGIAVGELNLMSLLPFSANYIGFVGDSMNIAARLTSEAQPSEIVASNSFYRRLDRKDAEMLQEMPSVEGKNVGRIKCWKLTLDAAFQSQ